MFSPSRVLTMLTLAATVIALVTWAANAIERRIVTPPALEEVKQSVRNNSETQTTAITRLTSRVSDVESRMMRMEDLIELMAIDVCLRRRSDPYATRKMNCSRYLDESQLQRGTP